MRLGATVEGVNGYDVIGRLEVYASGIYGSVSPEGASHSPSPSHARIYGSVAPEGVAARGALAALGGPGRRSASGAGGWGLIVKAETGGGVGDTATGVRLELDPRTLPSSAS